MRVWSITDGSAGMEAQVRALGAALGLVPEMKTVCIRKPFVSLPNRLYAGPLRPLIPHLIALQSDALAPPYPNLVISCGRRAAIAAMGLKRRAPQTRFIHIQDPLVSSKHFDLVVAMEHDRITGDNVIKTRYALHSITPQALAEARKKFAPLFAAYPSPKIAVLLGGSTNKYNLTEAVMRQVIALLRRILDNNTPCSLLITPSRRTGERNIALLRAESAMRRQNVYIYDFASENPYTGLLALSDVIVITDDSVNMMSEARATGKPLYILKLPGHRGTKPARFAAMLVEEGSARWLENGLETWSYPVRDEMAGIANEVRQRLALP